MTKPNPSSARDTVKRRLRPGGEKALQKKLWEFIRAAEERVILDPDADPELVLKALHGMAQIAGQYLKTLEQLDVRARVEALEASRAGAAPSEAAGALSVLGGA